MSCSGELEYSTSVALAVLHSVSGFLSVFGNVVVIYSVYRTPSLHSVSNYYIVSLAFGDLLVGLVISPLWVAKSALNIWQNQHPLTVTVELMSMQTLITTTFNLAAVSFDRYLAITSAFRYVQVMTPIRCVVSIVFIWLFSVSFAGLRPAITKPIDLPKLWITVAVVGYMLPFAIISYSYYRIYKVAKTQSSRIAAQTIHLSVVSEIRQSASVNTETRRRKKAANTIGILIGVYLILACPSLVIAGIQLFSTDECFKIRLARVWYWGALTTFISSAVNPWIYAVRNQQFRQAFKKAFRSCLPSNALEDNSFAAPVRDEASARARTPEVTLIILKQ